MFKSNTVNLTDFKLLPLFFVFLCSFKKKVNYKGRELFVEIFLKLII